MKKIHSVFSVLVMSGVLTLTACGGGGGTPTPTTSIGLTPALGAFTAGATVEAFKTDGTSITSGTTDSNGVITGLAIPTSYTDAIILRVKGGSNVKYFDEGKNAQVDLSQTDTLISVLPAGAVVADGKLGITPLTTLAAGLAGVDATGANPTIPGSATVANAAVTAAFDKVKALTGLVDFDLTQAPNPLKDLTSQRDAASKSDLYGVILAEMAKAAGADGALAQAKKMYQAGKSAKDAGGADAFAAQLLTTVQTVQGAMDQVDASDLLINKGSDDFKKIVNASAVAVPLKDLFSETNLNQLITSRRADLASQVTLRDTKPLSALEGIWDTAAGATLPASGVITPDGRVLLRLQPSANTSRIVLGQFKSTSNGYEATGMDILMQGDQLTVTDVTLTIEQQVTKTSPVTLVIKTGQTQESFSLSYSNRYETPVALADFVGSWSDVTGYVKVTWAINNKGEISGTSSSACTWVGKVTKRNENKGVANVVVKETCNAVDVELRGLVTFKAGSNKQVARVTLTNGNGSKVLLLELNKS